MSTPGLDAIKGFEGLRLAAYPDPATGGEPWTIGYGRAHGVQPGDTITREQAEEFLQADLADCDDAINACVNVPLTDGQRWALRSFTLNLGAGALKDSTLLRFLNAGDYQAAADQFPRWIFANKKPMPGLISRRTAERSMFLEGLEGSPATHAPIPPETAPQPQPEAAMPIPAILAALLPSLIEAIPKLAAIFKPKTAVAERNVAAVQLAFDVAKQAVGATNEQELVQKLQTDPAAVQAASQAIEANWFALAEAGGGGIDGARKADAAFVATTAPVWRSPSFLAMCLLLPLVYLVVGAVVGLFGKLTLNAEVSASILTGVVTLICGSATGFYFGSTTTRNKPAQ